MTTLRKQFFLFALVTFLVLVRSVVFAQTDRDELISLYNATGGDSWSSNSGWKDSPTSADGFNEEPCTEPVWYGVTCTGFVSTLYLNDNQLTGEIPAALGNTWGLKRLNLGDNQLTGEIPAELANLSNLEYLNLGDNQLTGEIPAELSNLTNLEQLSLGGNQLTGEIPKELGNLTNLNDGIEGFQNGLDLGNNHLYTDSNTLREFINSKSAEPFQITIQ